MITISFDEQGTFENTHLHEHLFIAGLLFDDFGFSDETETERKRIYRYHKKICDLTGTAYPADLHVKPDKSNIDQVKLTKTLVNRTLGYFLKNGVYYDPEDTGSEPDDLEMNPRKGKYYLFMKLRSEKGRKDLIDPDSSILIRDSYASNLYIHMVEEILEEVLLCNPFIKNIQEVFFDLPTRTVYQINRSEQYEKLDHLRLKRLDPSAEEEKFMIGNSDIYRTSVEQAIKNAKKNIQATEFRVFPMTYENNNGNRQSFLHLSDSICSLIGFNPSSHKPGQWIFDANRICNELVGSDRSLVFAYDEADVYWQKAYKALEDKHLYEAFNLICDGEKCGSSMAKYYAEVWYPHIERRVASCDDLAALEEAAKKLQASTYSTIKDQGRLLCCFETLQKAVEPFEKQKEAEKTVFALYDAGFAAYNHTGQSEKAIACREKSFAVSAGQDIRQVLRMRNRLAVAYCDQLNFKEALNTVNGTIQYEQMISTMRMEMDEGDSFKAAEEGKALSQRGQIYAFMCNNEAENDFLNALDLMESDKDNYLITMSYLLQYYLDAENKEKYEKYAKIYFESDDLYEQFTNLINKGCDDKCSLSLKFSLYIFVRAIWAFYRDFTNSPLKTALLNIESALVNRKKEAAKEIGGHPWELIYKYLAFYAYSSGNTSKAKDYIRKSRLVLNDGGKIIEQIKEESQKQYERLVKGEQIIDPKSPLTYMYR